MTGKTGVPRVRAGGIHPSGNYPPPPAPAPGAGLRRMAEDWWLSVDWSF